VSRSLSKPYFAISAVKTSQVSVRAFGAIPGRTWLAFPTNITEMYSVPQQEQQGCGPSMQQLVAGAPTLSPGDAATAAAAAMLGGAAATTSPPPPAPPHPQVTCLASVLSPTPIVARATAALLAAAPHAVRPGHSASRGACGATPAGLRWLAALLAGAGALALVVAAVVASFSEAAAPAFSGGWWRCWAAALALAGLASLFNESHVGLVQGAAAAIPAALCTRLRSSWPSLAPSALAPSAAPAGAGEASGPVALPGTADAGAAAAPAPESLGPLVGAAPAASGPRCLLDLGVLQQLLRQHQRSAADCSASGRDQDATRGSLYHSPLRHVFVGAKVGGRGLQGQRERRGMFERQGRAHPMRDRRRGTTHAPPARSSERHGMPPATTLSVHAWSPSASTPAPKLTPLLPRVMPCLPPRSAPAYVLQP
jgi:hypothetical protein